MKNIFISILSLIFFVLITGCSSNNNNSNPQFRIQNEQLNKVSVKIQTSGSSKINTIDVEPEQITDYQTAPVGNITATAVIQNESISFPAAKNTRYTIVIGINKPPSMHVDK